MTDTSDPYAGMSIEDRIAHIKGGGAAGAAPATSDPGELRAPLPAGALPSGSKLDDRTIEEMEGRQPSLAPAPPLAEWPGVLARTYERSIPSWAHGVDPLGLHPMDDPSQPPTATSGPPVPAYEGGLGLGQRVAATYANPPTAALGALGPEGAAAAVGGDLGAWIMDETGQHQFAGPASVVTGLGTSAAVRSGTQALVNAANQPSAIARHLAGEGGFEIPATAGLAGQMNADTVNVAGRVLQQELGTTRWPPSSPLLRSIRGAATPTEAFNLATDPANLTARFVNNMSPRARTAIAAAYVHSIPNNPGAWTALTGDVREALIPEERIRTAVTNAATRITQANTAAATARTPGQRVMDFLTNHFLSKSVGAGIGGLLGATHGITTPVGEAIGAAVGSQIRNIGAGVVRDPLQSAVRGGTAYAAGRAGQPGTPASPQSRTRNLLTP